MRSTLLQAPEATTNHRQSYNCADTRKTETLQLAWWEDLVVPSRFNLDYFQQINYSNKQRQILRDKKDPRWGQAYPATSQKLRQIISRYSDDAANQAYPTCRSILLENPSPSLKSSKIACLFNLFAAFIHSFNQDTNYFILWKSY